MENPFTADKQPFSMTDLISGIKSSEVTAEIYPDTSVATRVLELVDQLAEAAKLDRSSAPRSIVEDGPETELRNELDALREKSVEITFRALSNKEFEAVKNHVVATYKIDKKWSEDQRLQAESDRSELIYAHLIAKATVRVEDHIHNTAARALSVDDAESLRAFLPGFQWEKLKQKFDEAQAAVAGLMYALGDPTFRGDESVSDGELGVSGEPEGSESE